MSIITTPFSIIFGIIHIILFVWAFFQILGSSMSPIKKIIWMLIVGFFPIVGLAIWMLIGNKK